MSKCFCQKEISEKVAHEMLVKLTNGNMASMTFFSFRFRSSIVLWRQSIDLTTLVWAHELGHALNMTHDFLTDSNGFRSDFLTDRVPKFDGDGSRCSNGKGYYDQEPMLNM